MKDDIVSKLFKYFIFGVSNGTINIYLYLFHLYNNNHNFTITLFKYEYTGFIVFAAKITPAPQFRQSNVDDVTIL